MRAALTRFVQHVPHATAAPWVLCAKGIEQHTGMFVRDIAAAIAPHHPCGLLSGPNFADDIGRGMPAASVLASTDAALCTRLAAMLTTPTFRIYTSQDCVGVQLGGALKNVVAIACGMAIGYGLGESARASLIPRSIAELTRLGVAMGATPATFAGLSCLGDMVLTCTSPRSRNTALGIRIGQGMALQAALAHSPHVAEGVPTATAVAVLAAAHGVALPLCQAVQHVLTGEQPLAEAITALLTRPLSEE
jgi:glycerol-3-phosphate dehydrogenase (NAD(P)+)